MHDVVARSPGARGALRDRAGRVAPRRGRGELTGWIASSADGAAWTAQGAGEFPPLYDVTWNGSEFLAVGAHGRVRTSADGVRWSEGSVGLDRSFFSVTWTGALYQAVGEDGLAVESADGRVWTRRESANGQRSLGVDWVGGAAARLGKGGTILDGGCSAAPRRAPRGSGATSQP